MLWPICWLIMFFKPLPALFVGWMVGGRLLTHGGHWRKVLLPAPSLNASSALMWDTGSVGMEMAPSSPNWQIAGSVLAALQKAQKWTQARGGSFSTTTEQIWISDMFFGGATKMKPTTIKTKFTSVQLMCPKIRWDVTKLCIVNKGELEISQNFNGLIINFQGRHLLIEKRKMRSQ